MQELSIQHFKASKWKRAVTFGAVTLVAVACSLFFATLVRAQVPAKQDQSVTSAEKAAQQSPDQPQPVATKAEMQQKQLAEDTAKLLQLANELKADMDKTTKDTLSLAVVKKAEQVEKLAHKVREEMKASIGN